MTKNEIFDSWAARFGALAILKASQAVFQNHHSAKSGILLGVLALAISCFFENILMEFFAIRVVWFSGLLKFFTIGFKDVAVAVSLFQSTIIITVSLIVQNL